MSHLSDSDIDEKTPHCLHSSVSRTPHLDAHLRSPTLKSAVLALSAALSDAVNDTTCTQCAYEGVVRALASGAKDLREAQAAGGWSKEDKKAVKREVKGLVRENKGMVKKAFRKG